MQMLSERQAIEEHLCANNSTHQRTDTNEEVVFFFVAVPLILSHSIISSFTVDP